MVHTSSRAFTQVLLAVSHASWTIGSITLDAGPSVTKWGPFRIGNWLSPNVSRTNEETNLKRKGPMTSIGICGYIWLEPKVDDPSAADPGATLTDWGDLPLGRGTC